MKWWELVLLLVSVVGSAVAVTWCIKGELSDIELSMAKSISGIDTSIVEVQSVHNLDMAKIRGRLTTGGWSRPAQQKWIDLLRPMADHQIPDLGVLD